AYASQRERARAVARQRGDGAHQGGRIARVASRHANDTEGSDRMNDIAQRGMMDRMIGAAQLNIDVYEEVEADSTATGQAAGVVAIAAICSAIGGIGGGAEGAFGGLIAALVGWLLWAGVTYLIGDKLLGGTATWG